MISTTRFSRRRGMKFVFLSLLLFLYGECIWGQQVSVGTNLLNYLNLGTINAEVGLGVSQHFSLYIQGEYNPFKYKFSEKQINNRQISAAVGCKYWLWHNYSGWFVSSQMGFSRYNRGGIFSQNTYEGDAYGVTLGAGYALMINSHLNIDFGAGFMGGYTDYTKYACPSCGKIEEKDKKIFIAPDNIMVQLEYLF